MKIWIVNHYASNMYRDKGGRHYSFAKYLMRMGHDVSIFCANTLHNCDEIIDTNGRLFKRINDDKENIPFVFIKTSKYNGNGLDRVRNMTSFYFNVIRTMKAIILKSAKPDVIIASSAHPLTLVAGLRIGKKFDIPCICEIRDLWPESLVAYGHIKEDGMLTKLLYHGEKWIYSNADILIFTMEGGKDYIINQGWDNKSSGKVDITKVYHINNGVDLERFIEDREKHVICDDDLENLKTFKVIYTGSIRSANNIKKIVDVAQSIKKNDLNEVCFIIYGDGDERLSLENYCAVNGIDNIIFKGLVNKKNIPYILSKSDLNIFHFEQNSVSRYGASLNKMFEYFASGKPTISDCEFGYDIIKNYNCGIVVNKATASEFACAIKKIYGSSKSHYNLLCKNALKTAQIYDYKILSEKLIELIRAELIKKERI